VTFLIALVILSESEVSPGAGETRESKPDQRSLPLPSPISIGAIRFANLGPAEHPSTWAVST